MDDHTTAERRSEGLVKAPRRDTASRFASPALQAMYHAALVKAQDCFLKRAFDEAASYAAEASRIRPTSQIFALLAAISEGRGHFERATDFRFLQAFMSNDKTLWQELLAEFLEKQQFYRATVCLQRLSALEKRDAHHYRSLQIQLADLYIGLGETKRASTILVNMWQGSRYRDFEVFASLSSMYFQLGRWSSLNQVLKESLELGFRRKKGPQLQQQLLATGAHRNNVDGTNADDAATAEGTNGSDAQKPKRHAKRVAFLDVVMEEAVAAQQREGAPSTDDMEDKTSALPTSPPSAATEDDFGFDDVVGEAQPHQSAAQHVVPPSVDAPPQPQDAIDVIDLSTPNAIKNFLTLINVQSELYNEQGKFDRCSRLLQRSAALLSVPLLELPPDLLLRYGVAMGFMGGASECDAVFDHLLMTCPLDAYGDALYDASINLQTSGRHEGAIRILQALRRYHMLTAQCEAADDDDEDCADMENTAVSAASEDDATRASLVAIIQKEATRYSAIEQAQRKAERTASKQAAQMTEAALTFHLGKSLLALGRDSEAYTELRHVLSLDPHHVESRVELSKLLLLMGDEAAAEDSVVPLDGDDPFQVVVLSAQLLPVLKRRGKLLEAIGVGVGLFQLFLVDASEEGGGSGDRMSTVSGESGASRRSRVTRYSMPSLTRASSAIVPASALSEMLRDTGGGGGAMSVVSGSKTFGVMSSTQSIAATFRSVASPMSAVSISKRGSMTSTYAGSTAATSVAGGGGGEGSYLNKDGSALFSFHKHRKGGGISAAPTDSKRRQSLKERAEQAAQRLKEYEARYLPDGGADGGSVGNVDELEEMERMLADTEDAQQGGGITTTTDDAVVADASPSTEALQPCAKRARREEGDAPLPTYNDEDVGAAPPDIGAVANSCFNDPNIAALFIECTAGPGGKAPTGSQQQQQQHTTCETSAPPPQPPSSRDILQLVGRNKLIALAVDVVDCYAALERYVEAKEFATIVLTRWSHLHKRGRSAGTMAHPLRLAVLRCSAASGNAEDAAVMAVQLLSEGEGATADMSNDVWALLAHISSINVSQKRNLQPILLRALTMTDRRRDVPLLTAVANNYLTSGSVRQALNMFLVALAVRPSCAYLNFMVGLCFCLSASQRTVAHVPDVVSAGLHYLQEYRRLVLDAADDAAEEDWIDVLGRGRSGDGSSGAADADDHHHDTMADNAVVGAAGSGVGRGAMPRDEEGLLLGYRFRLSNGCDLPLQPVGIAGPPRLPHLRESKRIEVDYNTARVFHFLELFYLAVPLYEGVVRRGLAYQQATRGAPTTACAADATQKHPDIGSVVHQEVAMLVRLASINLYWIFSRVSMNTPLALSWLQ